MLIKVWDMRTMRCCTELQQHTGPVYGLHVEAQRMISVGLDGNIVAWEFSNMRRDPLEFEVQQLSI